MVFVGGVDKLTLGLDVADGTTNAVVTVRGPAGQTLTPTATPSVDRLTWNAYPSYTAAERWVAEWTVTGVGAGKYAHEIWVSAIPAAGTSVAWRPELWHVAAYVPRRTIVGAVDGSGIARRTFDETTNPPNDVVWNLITDACGWVSLLTGDVDESLYEAARACASKHAAAWIEIGYPDNRDDIVDGELLLKHAEQMRKDLAAANVAIVGDDPATTSDDVLPEFVFPAAVSWGDAYL